jgi:hypothetical protein
MLLKVLEYDLITRVDGSMVWIHASKKAKHSLDKAIKL